MGESGRVAVAVFEELGVHRLKRGRRSLRVAFPVDNLDIQSRREGPCVVMEGVGTHLGPQTEVEGIESFRNPAGEADIQASVGNRETAVFVELVHRSISSVKSPRRVARKRKRDRKGSQKEGNGNINRKFSH